MKNHYGWKDKDVAEFVGNTVESVTTIVNSKGFPRWLKLAIVVFEIENGLKEQLVLL